MSNEKTFIFDSSEGQKDNKSNANVTKILGTAGVITVAAALGVGGVYAMSSSSTGTDIKPTEVNDGEIVEESATHTDAGKSGKGVFDFGKDDNEADALDSSKTIKGTVGGTTINPTGTTFNPFTAPHAHGVNDNMSFAQAFASARQETGAGGVFAWRGQVYGTFYATEVDANMNPTIGYPKTDYNANIWQGYQHGHGTGYEQHYGGTMGKSDYFERQEGWLPVTGTVTQEGQVEGGGLIGSKAHEDFPEIPPVASGGGQAEDVDFLQGHGQLEQQPMGMAQTTPEISHDDIHDHDISCAHDVPMGDHGGLMDHMDSMS